MDSALALVKSEEKEPVKVDVLTDIKNPQEYPWPYEDGSVDELTVANIFEFIPGKDRGRFMDEVYRVIAPEGKAAFTVPYWNTARGIWDFRYEWPPLCEQSFLYFNKEWREANKVKTDLVCDLHFTYGYQAEAETAARNEESRSFYIKHYTNCVDALHLMLTKQRPK
jgi:ubiquinone/menaquinone biosynthesis C-methylase UbiE